MDSLDRYSGIGCIFDSILFPACKNLFTMSEMIVKRIYTIKKG